MADKCAMCGRPLVDSHRRDVRFRLPDPVLAVAESARAARTWGNDVLMQVEGIGSFVRVLLAVKLVGAQEIVYGVWLGVRDDDLIRAWEVWFSDAYRGLELDGHIANAIAPWGDATLGTHVSAKVLAQGELPYVVTSSNKTLERLLTEEWPAAEVLAGLPTGDVAP